MLPYGLAPFNYGNGKVEKGREKKEKKSDGRRQILRTMKD
jgi:hypothetical protein